MGSYNSVLEDTRDLVRDQDSASTSVSNGLHIKNNKEEK